ncbi:RNA polymerase sigma factor [Aeromicrobium sp. Root495]|uniref:RNA polymerase sigma factor n=1 Tax=Aeromicrobium sp. Root495 TaxID=1736550 RepID=UPI001F457F9D|nr:RNA polymerase sigma factor [Aeromicrobium sp. Root495]
MHHDPAVDAGGEEPSDRVLVRLARLGDRSAFDAIVERHGPGMYRFALRMVGGHDADAAEVVQEAFVSAWKNLETFEARSTLRTWLFSLTSRRAVDLQRRRRPTPVDDEFLALVAPPAQRDPLQDVLDRELVAALQVALTQLPDQQRAVWLLREVEDMSYDEIATTLAITPDSVRGQLHRGRQNLAERMAPWR